MKKSVIKFLGLLLACAALHGCSVLPEGLGTLSGSDETEPNQTVQVPEKQMKDSSSQVSSTNADPNLNREEVVENGLEKSEEQSANHTAAVVPPDASSYYHYIRFERYNRKGQLNDALKELNKAIERDPENIYLQKKMIFLYLSRKEKSKALRIAEALYINHPENSSVILLLAKLKQQLNQIEEARGLYQKILKKDEANRNVYIVLGNMYMENENFDDAFRVFSRMADRFPDDYVPHFFLGRIHNEKQNNEYAEKAFLRCLELKNDLVEPRFELISINKIFLETESPNKKLRTQIITLYDEILSLEPHNIRALIELPVFLHLNGQKKKAASMFSKLAEKSQRKPTMLMLMAKEVIGNENYEDAAVLFSEMQKRDKKNDALNYFTALAYDGLKQSRKAIGYFLNISKSADQYKKAAIHVAFLYNDLDETDTAITFLEKKHEEMPRDIDIISYLAAMYEDKGMITDALRLLRRGLDYSPDNTEILFRSGVLLDKLEEKDACILTMKKVIALDPEHAGALNYLGYTYAELGKYLDEAEKMILKALEQKPHDGFITDSLGWVYYKKGQFEKAVEVLQRAETLSSADPLITEHLGDAYKALKQYVKARDAYLKALSNSTDAERQAILHEKISALESTLDQATK